MPEVLRQLYLVLPSRNGWAVNLGADTLQVFPTRSQARTAAMSMAVAAMAEGQSAGFVDPDAADELD